MLPTSTEWEMMPREAEVMVRTPHLSIPYIKRFNPELLAAIERGEVETEYRVKNSRYPDPRNRFWWRLKPQPELF
jgi:hypothetical protein